MRMMDELRHLFLYSSNKKVYAPVDEKERRKGSAILLLTPNMAESIKLTNLSYLHNPNLFNSFYIDRNVMAYIDNVDETDIELDEVEEEKLSEAMLWRWNTSKCKISFDDGVSIMNRRFITPVINNDNLSKYTNILEINTIPEEIKIIVYPNSASLQKEAPKNLMNVYKNDLYSFTKGNEIHIISYAAYNERTMGGPYNIYLLNEFLVCIMSNYNADLLYVPTKAIANALSGYMDWKKKSGSNLLPVCKQIDALADTINSLIKKDNYNNITKYLKTADLKYISSAITGVIKGGLKRVLFEAELSYFERQRLLPSQFGIPEKRKYPMPDEEHVRLAIKMFNHCDADEEERLAEAIIKRIEKFGITDVKVSAANRFKKYYNAEKKNSEPIKEGTFIDSDYEKILKICSHLSGEEFSRISFYDTYRNSQFVVKRIINHIAGEPAGFLDAYYFPSQPDIVQVTIAVDSRFRGRGIADSMVKDLLTSDLPERYKFSKYYWTAHPSNDTSIYIALKNGFVDTNRMDKYGRKIFLRSVSEPYSIKKEIPDGIIPTPSENFTESASAFATDSFVIFNEANEEKHYSQKLKRYLYNERIKNSREVLNLYDKVKEGNSDIKRTYPKISMYRKFNIFVDLSYYHSLFLKNNTYKLDRAINFYFEFLNRLINNKEIDAEYKKKTIFIPIDAGVWPVQPMTEITDFKKNLNPISIIFRLIRTNPQAIKTAWGNKTFIFVGSRGYFKIDFNKVEPKDLTRIKTNLRKLMSVNEPIEDDFEIDNMDGLNTDADSKKARTVKILDDIENSTSININNISNSNNTKDSLESETDGVLRSHDHLRITSDALSIGKDIIKAKNGIAVLSIDPDSPEEFDKMNNSVLGNINSVNTYCIIENI